MYRADKIRGRQAERGWSNEELAEKADVNVNTITAVRQGKSVSLPTLRKVAKALDLSMQGLFEPKSESVAA